MKLMTNELRQRLPKLHTQETQGLDAIAYAKWFSVDAGWTWWATEFDGDDLLFGLVHGFEEELGYFRLSELHEVRGCLGLPVERDLYFSPTPLRELMR